VDRLDTNFVSLPEVWACNARIYPDKDAAICGDRRLTWAQFHRTTNRIANALLRDGVGKGDKVAVLMSSSIETLLVIFGALKAGACVVPLSPMLAADQVVVLINDAAPVLAFVSGDTRTLVEPNRAAMATIGRERWIAVGFAGDGWRTLDQLQAGATDSNPAIAHAPDDDFFVLYSSGTTGLPKGILHSHFSRRDLADTCALEMRFDLTCRTLTTTSLHSTGTFLTVMPTLLVGGTLVIMEKFSPTALLETIQRERITHTFMVPTQFVMVLNGEDPARYDRSSLKCVLSAGSPLRHETKVAVLEKISPALFELYGNSEGFATMLKPEQRAAKFDTVGPPFIGHEMKIVANDGHELPPGEIGEIVGRGGSMLKQYLNRPDETAAALWRDAQGKLFFRSGDIGRMDDACFVTVLDRKKDMIISGGFNVFPVDIETVIAAHEAVQDVTVIGIPHAVWGETPLALVIRHANATAAEAEILAWANQRLAKHQRVSAVEFRDEFPRNALGKVLKRQLREPYAKI
jgi:long-chain acyl-CoA synthetase